jgi:hypothetical protein
VRPATPAAAGRRIAGAAAAVVLTAVGSLAAVPVPLPGAVPEGDASAGHPVVVELFTSQGCFTCPPADRLLARLGREAGGQVVPLAFHVDSWNHAGWTDPFSDAAWSRRHAFYARTLRADGAFTPQAVVDGAVATLGSDETALRAAIAAAAARPAATIRLELEPGPKSVAVQVAVDLPVELRDRKLDLMLAVFETGLETAVGRGENGGRKLLDDYVVRTLERAGRIPGGAVATSHLAADLALRDGWVRARLGVAAFVQDPKTLSIHGATLREVEPGQTP